jgi:hypothetical protein
VPRLVLALVATLAALLAARPASACGSSDDYVAPSNFELVRMADAIGIYTAVSGNTGPQYIFGNVTFRREQALKGAPPAELTLDMAVLGDPDSGDRIDLEPAFLNPDYGGGCSRVGFERGGRVLMILERGANGDWYPVPYVGGGRAKDDYEGENSSWARIVRRYLALQSLRPAAQLAALTRMRDSGRDRDGSPLPPQERADIAHHLRAPSQWKPTAWLLERYARAARGEAVDIALDGHAQRTMGADPARAILLMSLANGHHPGARSLIERLAGAPGTSGRELAMVLRYLNRHGQYPRAYRWIETRLAARLTTLEPDEAQILLREVADVQHGQNPEWGHERWRADARAAATWPEVALGLYWFQADRLRSEDIERFRNAFDAIPVSDYRARPLLSVALAATSNAPSLAWASAELARLPAPPEREDDPERWRLDEPALLPARMLVSSWRRESEPGLIRAFCQGGARRRTIVDALRLWGDPDYHELLGRMAAFPGLAANERARLLQAVLEMSARGLNGPDHARTLGDADSRWLLTRLLRGQPPGGTPLSCPG